MFQLFCSIFLILPLMTQSQGAGRLVYPIVNEPLITIFIDIEKGSDTSIKADENSPLASFDSVFKVLVQKTKGMKGNISCAVHVKKGHYVLKQPIEQTMSMYMPNGNDSPKLHISFIGIEDSVIIDGKNITRTGGYGLLRICGSNVTLSNFSLQNAPSFGIVLGQPFARSKNVLIENVTIDTTLSHGLLIGDIDSKEQDTVMIRRCSFIETNRMNVDGSNPQWGSALKLFGASHVWVDSCYFSRNWSEAISINDSRNVRITRSTFIDNFAPSVYCDIAQNVTVDRNMFVSTNDSTIFKTGKRGMVAVLLSNEAWSPTAIDHFTSGIDIHSNIMLNQGGVLDIWEGTASFLQKAHVQDIRFAFNSCFGMSAGKGSTNAGIITTVYSAPFPFNRTLSDILIYGNIFSVDPAKWSPNYWMRTTKDLFSKFMFQHNRWNREYPTLGTYVNDDSEIMPDTFSFSMIGQISLKKRTPSLPHVEEDFFGRKRETDSTYAGAFELSVKTSIEESSLDNQEYVYDYFPSEQFVKPYHWEIDRIICVDLKGRTVVLNCENGIYLLPGKGPYFLIPKK